MATLDEVKQLRDETGVSIMQCKKALEEAGGDIEKAKVVLRKLSAGAAAKKPERELGSGTVQAYVHAGNQVAAVVVLACETDFVAKTSDFEKLAYDIALHIAAMNPKFLSKKDVTEEDTRAAREVFAEEVKDKPAEMQEKILQGKLDSMLAEQVLLDQAFVKDPSVTIASLIEQGTQKLGERIEIVEFKRFAV